jgi:hypothetical protein
MSSPSSPVLDALVRAERRRQIAAWNTSLRIWAHVQIVDDARHRLCCLQCGRRWTAEWRHDGEEWHLRGWWACRNLCNTGAYDDERAELAHQANAIPPWDPPAIVPTVPSDDTEAVANRAAPTTAQAGRAGPHDTVRCGCVLAGESPISLKRRYQAYQERQRKRPTQLEWAAEYSVHRSTLLRHCDHLGWRPKQVVALTEADTNPETNSEIL